VLQQWPQFMQCFWHALWVEFIISGKCSNLDKKSYWPDLITLEKGISTIVFC